MSYTFKRISSQGDIFHTTLKKMRENTLNKGLICCTSSIKSFEIHATKSNNTAFWSLSSGLLGFRLSQRQKYQSETKSHFREINRSFEIITVATSRCLSSALLQVRILSFVVCIVLFITSYWTSMVYR